MSFLEPMVHADEYYVIETNHGTECVFADVFSVTDYENIRTRLERDGASTHDLDGLADYIDGSEVYEIERKRGFAAYLSAPGYMDRTDYSFFETEEEAWEFLYDFYEVCRTCHSTDLDCGHEE